MEVGNILYSRNYYYITNNSFFKVISISDSGKTFTVRRLEPKRDYHDAPYNTYGTEVPSENFYEEETYRGSFTKKGSPRVNYRGDGMKILYKWEGNSLDFDHRS